jgi:hypothetical protein
MQSDLENAHLGFSDDLLSTLCAPPRRRQRGLAPWATWESENASLGKTFREWARFPKFLPIFICSDHGVHWESRCWENEIDSKYSTFFTWNFKKSLKMRDLHGKNSFHVTHPWVHYRKKKFGDPQIERSGTLVYFPHSNSTTSPTFKDLDLYITQLLRLPSKFHPVVLCLMSHDVEKGLHKNLRHYGIPIVTAGNTSSANFVDNFYSLLYQFKYATSPASLPLGSHAYYVLEAGIPFFLFGEGISYSIAGSISVKDGDLDLNDYGDSEDINRMLNFKASLILPRDEVSEAQRRTTEDYLGVTAQMSRIFAAWLLWKSLFTNLGEFAGLYLKEIRSLLQK